MRRHLLGLRALLPGCSLVLAAVAWFPTVSRATTYVSNLGEPSSVFFDVGSNALASSFTTDGANYNLIGVTLATHSNQGSASAQVKLRADNGGLPGTELQNLGSIVLATAGESLKFLASPGLILTSNTTYWITVGETGTGSASWKGTLSTAEVSPGLWTIGDQLFVSAGGGTNWQPVFFGPPNESCLFGVDAVLGGDTYVSNLAEANNVNFNITSFAHASSFTTDDGSYTLTHVTMCTHSSLPAGGSAEVKIRADNAGMPGALLEALGSIAITKAGTSVSSAVSSGLLLAPNTTYWVTVGEAGSGSASWKGTTSTAETSPGLWTIGDQNYFSNGGGTNWQPMSFGPPNESSLFGVGALLHATSVPEVEIARAVGFRLDPPFPNPTATGTAIRFALPHSADVSVEVYDAAGRLVRSVLSGGRLPGGSSAWQWDGRDSRGRAVASGVYHVRVRADGESQARSVVVRK